MRKIQILFFSTALIFIHLGFKWFYSNLLTQNSLVRLKSESFKSKNQSHPIWIFGDSHPMLGLDPAYLPGSFNFATTSENYFLNFIKLKNLLDKNSPPEILILPAELHSFSKQGKALILGHELDDLFWSQEINWKFINEDSLSPEFKRWWISAWYFPYAGQFYRISSLWKKAPYNIDSHGFTGIQNRFSDLPGKEQKVQIEERLSSHFGNYEEVDNFQIDYLRKIKSLCKRKAIEIVFIEFPVNKDYLIGCQRKKNLVRVDSVIKSETKDFMVLHYREVFKNQTELFSDPDHLNTKGAELISRKVDSVLMEIRKKPALTH